MSAPTLEVGGISLLERSLSSSEEDWPEFSHTQTQSWDRCELAWNYGYHQKWTTKRTNEGFLVGSIVHDMMEKVYSPLEERSPEEVLREYVADFMVIAPDFTVELNRAFGVTWRYFQDYAPVKDKGHKILAVESYFRVPFLTPKGRHYWLHGWIDVESEYDGKYLYTWDHKSMEGMNRFWTPDAARMDPQTSAYSVAKRELGTPVRATIINMINTYFYKGGIKNVEIEKLCDRIRTVRTDIELNSFIREFGRLIDEILEHGDTPRRSIRKSCENCAFKEPCIADMKGMSTAPIFLQKFEKRSS